MAKLTVRALETAAEVDTFFRLATQEFFPQAELEAFAAHWRQYVEENPGFQPGQQLPLNSFPSSISSSPGAKPGLPESTNFDFLDFGLGH